MNCNHIINWDQFLGSWQKWTIFSMKIVSWATAREQKELKIYAMLKKKWGRTHFYALLNTSFYCRKEAMSLNVLFQNNLKFVIYNIKHIPTPPLHLVHELYRFSLGSLLSLQRGCTFPCSFLLSIGNALL